MKIEIQIDDTVDETVVKIMANRYSDEIEHIKNRLLEPHHHKLSAFREDGVELLDYDEVVRIYSEDKKILLDTMNATYTTRLKLYELEERLGDLQFIAISRSEIINLNYVKRLDLSFTGTIAVEFKNGATSYVARRHLKNFKNALGL